jgi:hypothetical protein
MPAGDLVLAVYFTLVIVYLARQWSGSGSKTARRPTAEARRAQSRKKLDRAA